MTVRRLGASRDGDPRGRSGECAEAAIEGIDDAVVLVDERPVGVDELWRDILGDRGSGDLLIVHPSWWPPPRVERIAAAAAAGARCVRRCDVIAERIGRPLTIIEVDRELVTVVDGSVLSVHARHDLDAIVAAVRDGAATAFGAVFDAPAGVAGGALRQALSDRGIVLCDVDMDRLCSASGRPAGEPPAATAPDAPPTCARRRRRTALALTLVPALALIAAAAAWFRVGPHRLPAADTVALVEGRVAVAVPAQWTVRRVTGGPGSRRLEVGAPGDSGSAIHITWAYAPQDSLGAAAAVLGRAAAAQPPGVFSDLHTDVIAGRDVLTYQEVRPGRVIRWAVLLDGAIRIAVGCQSAPGGAENVRAACEDAVRSAREVR